MGRAAESGAGRFLAVLALWLGASAVVAPSASAFPAPGAVSYEILGPGVEQRFGFSWIHSAAMRMRFDGADYYPGGVKLFRVSGTLLGHWSDPNTLLLDPSQLVATGYGGIYSGSGDWRLDVLGGSFDLSAGRPLGSLEYRLTHPGGSFQTLSGAFYFDPVAFAGPANSMSATELALWGNNWRTNSRYWSQLDARPDRGLGIDLRAVSAPIPEPTALLVFGVGAAIVGASLRRAGRV